MMLRSSTIRLLILSPLLLIISVFLLSCTKKYTCVEAKLNCPACFTSKVTADELGFPQEAYSYKLPPSCTALVHMLPPDIKYLKKETLLIDLSNLTTAYLSNTKNLTVVIEQLVRCQQDMKE